MSMQVSDLMNQYQNSLAAGSEISTKTKGVEQLVKTVSSLTSGQVFEGTVNQIKGGQVILGLSSGQNIMARLDKGVSLNVGESVFFQVKSNEGNLVQIKPISIGTANNPTLLSALDAGGIPVNEKTLNMANAMMQQQMPIDAKSLGEMYRQVAANPSADPQTVVTMNRMGIPVTEGMAAQFENYSSSEGAILRTVDELSTGLPELLSSESVAPEDAADFLRGLTDTVLSRSEGEASDFGRLPDGAVTEKADGGTAGLGIGADGAGAGLGIGAGEAAGAAVGTAADGSVAGAQGAAATANGENASISNPVSGGGADAIAAQAASGEPIVDADGATVAYQIMIEGDDGTTSGAAQPQAQTVLDGAGYELGTVGHALGGGQYGELSESLRSLPDFVSEHRELFNADGSLSPEADTTAVLKAVNDYFSKHSPTRESFSRLVGSDGFGSLIRDSLSKEWTLSTDELTDQRRIDELYRKIAEDSDRISHAAHALTGGENAVSESAASIRDNVDFLSQINQMYTYVQLPLRMNGESATGDLYVYNNKRKSLDDDGEVSAFLHFDLEHLGSTDISVRMKDKNVTTKFFMEDEAAFELVQNNIHILQERLDALGYNCRIDVENGEHPVDFVEDFIKQDTKTGGSIQRYSFDVRA